MDVSLDYQFFSNYFNNFKKFDAKAFDLALQHVHNYAVDQGLSEEDLILVAKVSFGQELGVTRFRNLIKCLIPRCTVPDEVVELTIDWLLENYNKNISAFAKKIALQWFIGLIKYNIINPQKTINMYYDLLWYFLPFEIVNSAACNLIYLLAKPEDVNRWYVKQLLEVHKQFKQPKYTGALLLLFKSYRPECVPEDIPAYAVHKAFGVLPEFIDKHFCKAQERLENNNMIPKGVEGIKWYSMDIRSVKKTAIELIPKIIERESTKSTGLKTLMSIKNVKDLHKYIIQGNRPSSVMSLLNNTEGSFILIFLDNTVHEYFSIQLYNTLYEERNALVSYEEKDKLLNKLCILQNQMQQSIPVVSKFLAQFIIIWDGQEHETHIYGLLEWLNFKSYNELHDCILKFLYDLFISGTTETKSKILTTLANFIANVIMTYFCRIKNKMPCLFLGGSIKWKFHEIIFKLYEYITYLCKLGCLYENSNALILQTIINVNFIIMNAEENCNLHIWKLPSFLCYSALFTSHPSCLVGIVKLFNRFPNYVNENIKTDYTNTLFRKKAFLPTNELSVFNIFNEAQLQQVKDLGININDSLSCENHLALACFNYTLEERNKREFFKHAKKYFPDLLEFWVNNK